MQLRPYQLTVLPRLRALFASGVRAVMLESPVGSGKTVISAYFVESAVTKGSRVAFFAHRRELINQTYNKLLEAGVSDVAVMMSNDKRRNEDAQVQVWSVDTFRARYKPEQVGRWPAFDILIIDEAHRSCSDTYRAIIAHYRGSGSMVLGLSATPTRTDGRGLGDMYQHLEVVSKPSQLIQDGFIVEPTVYSTGRPDLTGIKKTAGDYNSAQLEERVSDRKLVGAIVPHWRRHADGMKTIVFAAGVNHSKLIVDEFRLAGVAAEHLDGNTPANERDHIFAKLEAGLLTVISNCDITTEGWDMPCVKCAILARPTASTRVFVQQVGRVMRPFQGQKPIILDHAGNCFYHGLPQEDRDYSLSNSKPPKEKRLKVRMCLECGAVMLPGVAVCPACGEAMVSEKKPIEHDRHGELVEVKPYTEQELRNAWQAITAHWEEINKTRTANDNEPYKPGWIYHTFKSRFHRAPPPGCVTPIDSSAKPEDKQAELERLRAIQRAKGFKSFWVQAKFKARFGHYPGTDADSSLSRQVS
jgi:DNA repair protein RadD